MPADEDPASAPLRLVLAEDHAGARVLIRTLLDAAEGIVVVGEAVNGADAVDLVQDLDADAVLLDVDMPVMDGLRAAELLRSLRPRLMILLQTADPDSEGAHAARDLGFLLVAKLDFSRTVDDVRSAFCRDASTAAA